ncbi:hypothetical protein CGK07_21995 [Vibrio parahaemolyticus]|nr:hypothetical protein CGK43_23530 [Vibrio parahaemolyticus]TOB33677.1 hypothetical protein CGK07_21995 [Vibrio parahaemolyticus]TOI17202.1 hypothetical protein CGI65_22895 [Vibrio parahaemolyticus]TOI71760.1 hypothetical protein CGI53_22870 [Vibrio parahaemolyticus]TOI74471.1 hypothetical protein CGI52_22875 [Vibrio parahaemolyticus]
MFSNKAFKSDSQRSAFSLRSSIAERSSHLNAALVCKRKNAAISQGLVVNAQSLSCRIGFQF